MPLSREQSLNFRKEDVNYVIDRWKAANSCSIVGIGSAGKSNLLQHLTDIRVRKHYLKEASDKVRPIVIDANLLGPLPSPTTDHEQFRCWAGYELMTHRMFLGFYPLDMLTSEEARTFYHIYQTMQDGNNPLYAYMGVRYFELCLEYFLRKDYKIAFLFDEFEELLRQLPIKFFQTLRGIRDNNKKNIIYMTFTRSPLQTIVERMGLPALEIESFVELFSDHIHYLGPYNETDAGKMLEEISESRNKSYPQDLLNLVMQVTGRYAGLMRASFNALEELPVHNNVNELSVESLAKLLITRNSVRGECKTIWTGLNRSEQIVLKAVARLVQYNVSQETEQAVNMLMQKRLLVLDKNQQSLQIEPPIFRHFVQLNPDPTS